MSQGCNSRLVSLCVCIKSSREQLIGQNLTYTDGLSTTKIQVKRGVVHKTASLQYYQIYIDATNVAVSHFVYPH